MRSYLSILLVLVLAACDDFRDRQNGIEVSICGNGTVDRGEECDDGNNVTEACAHGAASCTVCGANCRLVPGRTTVCGDGRHDPAHEECDDGNAVTEVCPWGQSCTICDEACRLIVVERRCGDGTIDEDGGERCDDGEENSNERPNACRTDCLPARCGDGVRDDGEECEPARDAGCRDDCRWIRCGDGFADPPEECDPASGAGDGCRDDCVLPRCGDGILDPGEACDAGSAGIVEVAWRGDAACILTEEGAVRCTGGSEAFRAVPESLGKNAASLSVGDGFACALATPGAGGGTIVCWGEDPTGDPARPVLSPPTGIYDAIALGDAHGCAWKAASTTVRCWGRIHASDVEGATGFRAIASGRGFTCGREFFGITCWGTQDFGIPNGPPTRFTAARLAAGEHHACVVRADDERTITCWGDGADGKAAPPPPGARVIDLALGADRSCALDEAGQPFCWGADDGAPVPEGPFERIFASGRGVCGLREGSLVCWGAEAPPLPVNADGVAGACRRDCAAPACGDGVVDPGEDCDDGDTIDDGDGCGADCRRTGVCGDGIVQPAVEECDDGNASTEACPWGTSCVVCDANCRYGPGVEPRCGDGLLDAPHEECDEGDVGPRFRAIAFDGAGACGLLGDGALRCWGGATPPAGSDYVDLAMGDGFVCGLAASGAIRCEGSAPPPGTWAAIEAAGPFACALDAAGAIACWGGLAAPPGAGWRGLSVGARGACALDPAGAIACWGADMPPPPAGGGHRAVAAGDTLHCAIDAEERLRCWGPDAPATLPAFRAAAVAAGTGAACALDATGSLACFGPAANPPRVGRFSAFAVAGNAGCAIGLDGLARCWPLEIPEPTHNSDRLGATCHADCRLPVCGDFLLDPGEDCDHGDRYGPWVWCDYESFCDTCLPSCRKVWAARPQCGDGVVDEGYETCDDGGSAESVTLGEGFGCLLHAGERPRCWGADDAGQSSAPWGAYAQITAGARHTCALDRGGQAHCWGADALGQLAAPRDLFQSIQAGRDFTCGHGEDGAIVCWGDVPFAQPIAGTWRSIGVGDRHLCALAPDGTIACWGANDRGQTTPPTGAFEAIAVGGAHGCALDAAGAATCWGDGAAGQTAAPPGPWDALVAGFDATCGRTPGGWSCWGAAPPLPPGDLATLALSRWSGGHACGTTASAQALVCAGAPGTLGAAPPPTNSDVAPDACRSDCAPARCGDGVIDTGEACDDGGTAPGDGCDAACQTEP